MCLKKTVITGLFLFLGLGFLFVESVVAQGKIEKVVVTGMGANEQGAIKNATKAAVQQVVGMYVVSEEVMKNQELIKDEVLTHSNAYVRSFKVLKKSKDEDGLIEINAQVEVEIGKLAGKLQDLNISIKAIETGEFFAVSADKLSSAKSFKNMAKKIIIDPIKKRKKIWDIKVLSLTPLEDIPKAIEPGARPHQIPIKGNRGDKAKYAAGELVVVRLDFKISLNEDYLGPVLQFLEKSSRKVHRRHPCYHKRDGIAKCIRQDRYDNLIPFFKPMTSFDKYKYFQKGKLIKGFELSKKNGKILKGQWKALRNAFLEITLMDSNKEELCSLLYKNWGSHGQWHVMPESSVSASECLYFTTQNGLLCGTNGHDVPGAIIMGFSLRGPGFAKNNTTFHVFLLLDEDKIEAVKNIKLELYVQ